MGVLFGHFFRGCGFEVRLKEGTGEYLEECRPLSRVAWYDGGREVRQDGTKVGRLGPGMWFGFPGELGLTSRWFAEDCLD